MDSREAIGWLREVDGQLYRNGRHPSGRRAWVAVVRTPGAGATRGKLIIALGSTMEEAASAAHRQWQVVWQRLSTLH
jgi:hypothetical protein